jgi:SAM-dependent methyltransferase
VADSNHETTGLEALTRAWLELGPNARRLLEYAANRLVIGKAHGDFDKPRDWDRETLEEEFDGAMYRAAKLLGFGKPPTEHPFATLIGKTFEDRTAPLATANVPHSPEFFAQMKTCREAYKRLALAFSRVLPAGCSVFDFGCGTGHQSAALAALGFDVAGVDPLVDVSDVEQGFEFYRADPISESHLFSGRDVAICTEVAEHVYEERADALVAAVCSLARERVIWSAARPGQEWEGHVNLQPAQYWLDKFKAHGFEASVYYTDQLRFAMGLHQAQHVGAASNFYVLDRTA